MRGEDIMGGPNFDRIYHKLKVLLLFCCYCYISDPTLVIQFFLL